MFEFKLQLGCLIILTYFIVTYTKDTLNHRVSCSPIFAALLVVTSWAVIFDGITAWTVNHADMVSDGVNLLFHGLFFVFMDLVTILLFVYMVNQMVGIRTGKMLGIMLLPGILSIGIILFFLDQLYYVQGSTTNYSMGVSVIACYISLFAHFFVIFALIVVKHRTIEKRKILTIVMFMILFGCILMCQVLFPEILFTSVVPVLLVIGIYISFENPSLRRLQQYNEDMVTGFATLVENRDNSTGGHIQRTKGYVRILMEEMKKSARYDKILTKDYYKNVINAAPMHDIGKISTPDYILQKPGKLEPEEYEIMKQHAAIGGDIIKKSFADLDDPEYQQIAYEVARFHHEKWNGKGYPEGISGEDIPLHARIMAIADVFDAVSAKRCYRDAMPVDKCFKIIEEGAGVDFDPELARLFVNARETILSYYEKEKDCD